MNWINGFEVLCYVITIMFLIDMIRRKDPVECWMFLSAALAGFALELLAVRVTDIYHYSTDFFISIGFKPYQFPLFGGLMWGGLSVYGLRVAKRLDLSPVQTALMAGWLIVTMDLFLDVAAIRLNGGFWVWDGREITLAITHHMFMSVIWVNFLGYLFETPAIVYLSLRGEDHYRKESFGKNLLRAIGIGLAGIAFVGIASGASLLINQITDEWFACIAFIILWFVILVMILRQIFQKKLLPGKITANEIMTLIYWTAMYVFCIAALLHLGIARARPVYFIFSFAAWLGTCYLAIGRGKEN